MDAAAAVLETCVLHTAADFGAFVAFGDFAGNDWTAPSPPVFDDFEAFEAAGSFVAFGDFAGNDWKVPSLPVFDDFEAFEAAGSFVAFGDFVAAGSFVAFGDFVPSSPAFV